MTEDETPEQFYGLKYIELKDEESLEKIFFVGNVWEVEAFFKTADNSIEIIRSTNSVRLAVLETWLLLDYSIREILLSVLGLSRVNHPDYELKQLLLPWSLCDCIDLMAKMQEVNAKLPEYPDTHSVKLPVQFIFYLRKENPNFLNKFLEIEKEYYLKYHPALSKESGNILTGSVHARASKKHLYSHEYMRILPDMLAFISRIDEAWTRKIRKLHSARNVAAHSHDEKLIADKMGYSGDKVINHIRNECLSSIEQLLGIRSKNTS
ncbi:MAG: hypothetical protein HY033_06655 [Ignavibacteriae bacterium]|nr:hypothetical protein [Ignavibacteria bacterium]MBI3364572.1 hypothetical protein [Ignavibacteriota bacterium]